MQAINFFFDQKWSKINLRIIKVGKHTSTFSICFQKKKAKMKTFTIKLLFSNREEKILQIVVLKSIECGIKKRGES